MFLFLDFYSWSKATPEKMALENKHFPYKMKVFGQESPIIFEGVKCLAIHQILLGWCKKVPLLSYTCFGLHLQTNNQCHMKHIPHMKFQKGVMINQKHHLVLVFCYSGSGQYHMKPNSTLQQRVFVDPPALFLSNVIQSFVLLSISDVFGGNASNLFPGDFDHQHKEVTKAGHLDF